MCIFEKTLFWGLRHGKDSPEPSSLAYSKYWVCLGSSADSSHEIWASMQENLSSWFVNDKGADQPAHPRNLISAFVIRFLESLYLIRLHVKNLFSS